LTNYRHFLHLYQQLNIKGKLKSGKGRGAKAKPA
jgi:hypothetical protein